MKQKSFIPLVFLCSFFLVGCASVPHDHRVKEDLLDQAALSEDTGLPILKLHGDAYQMGYQHGYLLREEIHAQWKQIMSFATSQISIPLLNRLFIHWKLGSAYRKMEPFISSDLKQEMLGLARGARIPLAVVHRAHALPDLYPTLCANGAYFGGATAGGKLYHLRNLDWNRQIGVHKKPCVFVVHPEGKNAFVNVGYIGFIGVLSGINEFGLAVGQIGCDTVDHTLRGEPMPFLLRRVLEETADVDHAALIVKNATRTYGYNYVFSDAKAKRALALETTAKQYAVFMPDDVREAQSGYGFPSADMIARADTAFDPVIRGLQTASGGNPKTPELEAPTGSAYEKRYKLQLELAQSKYGRLNHEAILEIAHEIAPGSNIQSILFAYPDLWIANAEGDKRAVDSTYHHLQIDKLLEN